MNLRLLLTGIIVGCVILTCPVTGFAQKKKSSKASAAKTAEPPKPDAATEKRAAAQQLSVQLKGLTQFLYVFGGVTKSFEQVEEASDTEGIPATAIRKTEKTRGVLAESIRNLRGNLERLENDFSQKSNLRPYFHYLIGVSDLATQAETQVNDGQLKEAGQSLLKLSNQLAETLAGLQD